MATELGVQSDLVKTLVSIYLRMRFLRQNAFIQFLGWSRDSRGEVAFRANREECTGELPVSLSSLLRISQGLRYPVQMWMTYTDSRSETGGLNHVMNSVLTQAERHVTH